MGGVGPGRESRGRGRGRAHGGSHGGANMHRWPSPPAASPTPPPSPHSSTLEWRAKYQPDTITWDEVCRLNTGRLELLDERDAAGRPINYFRLR